MILVSYGILCHYDNFPVDTSYEQTLSWMVDEFIHEPEPYLLLSTTRDETLSWMIEIWMKNHLVSDGSCNTVNLQIYKDDK